MAHEIGNRTDRVVLRGQQAWHKLGVVIQDSLGAVEAAERFGLTRPVTSFPLYAELPDRHNPGQTIRVEVPTHKANFHREDIDGNPLDTLLGVVGADYAVCQNRELAEFTDALAQSGKVVIESCGSVRDGKRVWFLARGDAFTIGGTNDKVHPYLLVSNGHDGTQAIRVTPTTVRVVCSNTLHMVIPQADDLFTRPDSAAITIRHSGKIADKLEQAKNALAYYGETLRRNQELFEAMQAKQVDRDAVVKLFADSYSAYWQVATPDDLASADKETKRIAVNRVERMRKASEAFLERYEQEKRELQIENDTVWLAFNAMSGFLQHDKTARGKDDSDRVARRMESNLFGVNATRTHEVLAASLALAS